MVILTFFFVFVFIVVFLILIDSQNGKKYVDTIYKQYKQHNHVMSNIKQINLCKKINKYLKMRNDINYIVLDKSFHEIPHFIQEIIRILDTIVYNHVYDDLSKLIPQYIFRDLYPSLYYPNSCQLTRSTNNLPNIENILEILQMCENIGKCYISQENIIDDEINNVINKIINCKNYNINSFNINSSNYDAIVELWKWIDTESSATDLICNLMLSSSNDDDIKKIFFDKQRIFSILYGIHLVVHSTK
jgi:hypothetical protein